MINSLWKTSTLIPPCEGVERGVVISSQICFNCFNDSQKIFIPFVVFLVIVPEEGKEYMSEKYIGPTQVQHYIRFRSIVYDTMTLNSRTKEYPLFNDERLINCNPVNLKEEKEIVRWLFSRDNFIQLLLSELGQRNIIRPFLEVPRLKFEISPEKDGDFDAIYCQHQHFDELTCLEFKKVKFDQRSPDDIPKLNGIGNLEKLIHQSNNARRTGFHNAYAAVVALINTANLPHPNVMTKFDPPKEYKRIYEIHNLGSLDSEVGTLLIEIEQPTGKDFEKKGQINIAKLKESTKQSQSKQVTEDFKRIYYKSEIKI